MYSEIDELNCMCKYDNISSNFRKNREKRKKLDLHTLQTLNRDFNLSV